MSDVSIMHMFFYYFQVRTLTNVVLFFIGLIVLGPFGILLQTAVPSGIFQFALSWMAISAIFAALRAALMGAMIVVKNFT